jgi:thiamine pyrophosphokinase
VRAGSAVDGVLAACRRAQAVQPWLVIAADGGALKAAALGLRPDVVVGDGDSLPAPRAEELRASGVEVIVHPADKDESDTQLAIDEAIARGATHLVILGAIGGPRLEHSLANVLLLSMPALAAADARIVDGPSELRVIGRAGAGSAEITGQLGDYVSLLPLSNVVQGVTTRDLRFPLTNATLAQGPARGLSNELSAPSGGVTTRSGRLAVIHTSRTEN